MIDKEKIAEKICKAYERLAPDYGYQARKDSVVSWHNVSQNNKDLMVAVCVELFKDHDLCDTSKEVCLNKEELRALTFSFDSRERLEAMIKESGK